MVRLVTGRPKGKRSKHKKTQYKKYKVKDLHLPKPPESVPLKKGPVEPKLIGVRKHIKSTELD